MQEAPASMQLPPLSLIMNLDETFSIDFSRKVSSMSQSDDVLTKLSDTSSRKRALAHRNGSITSEKENTRDRYSNQQLLSGGEHQLSSRPKTSRGASVAIGAGEETTTTTSAGLASMTDHLDATITDFTHNSSSNSTTAHATRNDDETFSAATEHDVKKIRSMQHSKEQKEGGEGRGQGDDSTSVGNSSSNNNNNNQQLKDYGQSPSFIIGVHKSPSSSSSLESRYSVTVFDASECSGSAHTDLRDMNKNNNNSHKKQTGSPSSSSSSASSPSSAAITTTSATSTTNEGYTVDGNGDLGALLSPLLPAQTMDDAVAEMFASICCPSTTPPLSSSSSSSAVSSSVVTLEEYTSTMSLLFCTKLAPSLLETWREREAYAFARIRSDRISKIQTHVHGYMRAQLVDWLIDVGRDFCIQHHGGVAAIVGTGTGLSISIAGECAGGDSLGMGTGGLTSTTSNNTSTGDKLRANTNNPQAASAVHIPANIFMSTESIFRAVHMVDRALSVRNVAVDSLQLLGATALVTSTSMEEVYATFEPADAVTFCGDSFGIHEVTDMQSKLLGILDWRCEFPTAHTWLIPMWIACGLLPPPPSPPSLPTSTSQGGGSLPNGRHSSSSALPAAGSTTTGGSKDQSPVTIATTTATIQPQSNDMVLFRHDLCFLSSYITELGLVAVETSTFPSSLQAAAALYYAILASAKFSQQQHNKSQKSAADIPHTNNNNSSSSSSSIMPMAAGGFDQGNDNASSSSSASSSHTPPPAIWSPALGAILGAGRTEDDVKAAAKVYKEIAVARYGTAESRLQAVYGKYSKSMYNRVAIRYAEVLKAVVL